MAIREILTNEDPVLRKVSRPIENFDERLSELISDMRDTLEKAQGVGLAAVQVGFLKRVVILKIDDREFVLINPKIVKTHGRQTGDEGCLSVPGRTESITRPARVRLHALDEHGKEIMLSGEGLFARAVCHEIDHLDGILYYDRITV